jgi:hypothetical protein
MIAVGIERIDIQTGGAELHPKSWTPIQPLGCFS